MPRIFAVLIITAILLTACGGGRPTCAAPTANQAAGTHRQVRCDSCMMKSPFAQ